VSRSELGDDRIAMLAETRFTLKERLS
jgi:hypothetical protein